jgi:hypothetical protein
MPNELLINVESYVFINKSYNLTKGSLINNADFKSCDDQLLPYICFNLTLRYNL